MTAKLLINAQLATVDGRPQAPGWISDAAVAWSQGRIEWVGPRSQLPAAWADRETLDVQGRLVTPGLIDCHTHLVFGGDRADEFRRRLAGETYAQIAATGGGIQSTVSATRGLDEAALLQSAVRRMDALLAEGVTTVEVKSGYGLEVATELKMLRVARQLGRVRNVDVRTTYLGAHTIPVEYRGRDDAYLADVVLPGLEQAAAAGLCDAVDGFCESIAFSADQIRRVFTEARRLELPVKLHAEQLSWQGGARLAAEFGALSADHLEYATAEDAAAMAAAGTVAVLLPGAYYTLGQGTLPPLAAFRQQGVPLAVATDCNPGSSPLVSLLTAMNLSCHLFGLTPEEALHGVTRHAAAALGLTDVGQVRPGFVADLAVWDLERPEELAYWLGGRPLHQRIKAGRPDEPGDLRRELP